MPWNMNDYPSSMKNLNENVRRKAIDIANAMLDEGYKEQQAIPIAMEQAKKWYEHTDKSDIDNLRQKDISRRGKADGERSSRPELMDQDEHVVAHEDGWAVKTEDAKRPSNVYSRRDDAIKRAREIAKNKGTKIVIHREDGSIQDTMSYGE